MHVISKLRQAQPERLQWFSTSGKYEIFNRTIPAY